MTSAVPTALVASYDGPFKASSYYNTFKGTASIVCKSSYIASRERDYYDESSSLAAQMNIYQHSQDFSLPGTPPLSTSDSGSRKSSIIHGLRDHIRFHKKKQPIQVSKRRMSAGSHDLYSVDSDSEGERSSCVSRKYSAPSPGLQRPFGDYAIMRRTSGLWEYELLTTFDKGEDPYRHYLESVTCYDLAPVNGVVVMFDSTITLHKALVAVQQSSAPAVLVVDSNQHTIESVFSHTDCLQAVLYMENNPMISEKTLGDYMRSQHTVRLLTGDTEQSLWDASQLFCEHHIHQLPIMQVDAHGFKARDVLYLLSHKDIFSEPLVKQLETHWKIAPYTRESLLDAHVGCWGDVAQATHDTNLRSVIKIFLDKKISSVPVVDDNGAAEDVLTKRDVIDILAEKNSMNYLDVLSMTAAEAIENRAHTRIHPFCSSEDTIGEAMELIALDQFQCLFVLDQRKIPVAAVSVVDLMKFISNWADNAF
uniref:CBS domain-containing protein n=1 Tax=Plectus sambesii TaxID=2011161 RepID=A0A914WLU9_9BILA